MYMIPLKVKKGFEASYIGAGNWRLMGSSPFYVDLVYALV